MKRRKAKEWWICNKCNSAYLISPTDERSYICSGTAYLRHYPVRQHKAREIFEKEKKYT